MDAVRCPGCGSAMTRVVDGGMHYACGSCHGRMVGLAPFERTYPAARQAWVATSSAPAAGTSPAASPAAGTGPAASPAAGTGPAAGTCPFCNGSLVAPAMDAPPPGLAACRRCEQFWVPPEAAAWFAAAASAPGSGSTTPAPPARPARPDTCPGCGAPWAPDPGGLCRYCREQLKDEPTTVFISAPTRAGVAGVSGGVVAGVLDVLLDAADHL